MYDNYGAVAAGGSAVAIIVILCVAYYVACIVAQWKIFTKAGQAGWKVFIPIYNGMTLFKIIYGSYGKYFMLLIPGFGEVLAIASMVRLGQVYGKNVGFRLGLVFLTPIFLFILGFGNAQYQGPVYSVM